METRGRDAAIFRGADVARQISIERGEIPELVLNGCSRMPLDNDAAYPAMRKQQRRRQPVEASAGDENRCVEVHDRLRALLEVTIDGCEIEANRTGRRSGLIRHVWRRASTSAAWMPVQGSQRRARLRRATTLQSLGGRRMSKDLPIPAAARARP